MSKRNDPFAALADPTRRRILELLRDRVTMTAGELAACFPLISRAAVSKHLRVLREAGLVSARELGREWHYGLEPAPLEEIYGVWLATFAPHWDAALQRLKERVEGAGAKKKRRARASARPGTITR